AFDHHPLGRLARLARVVSRDRSITDFFEDIGAFNQFSERRVLMIETRNRCETNKELRSGRIGIGAAGHRNDAALMGMIIEFGLDLVTRAALSVAGLFRWVFRIRIATLNHESLDDPMKT